MEEGKANAKDSQGKRTTAKTEIGGETVQGTPRVSKEQRTKSKRRI